MQVRILGHRELLFECIMLYRRSPDNDATKGMSLVRPEGAPREMRRALIRAREKRGWSQRDLASRLGVGQRHISGIESRKIVPRYGRPPRCVRMLDRDLMMVPRSLVPTWCSQLLRRHLKDQPGEGEERPLCLRPRGRQLLTRPLR